MKDIFGFDLSVGDTVAFVTSNSLTIGTIDHIYPKTKVLEIKHPGGYANKTVSEVAKRVLKPSDLKLLKFTI